MIKISSLASSKIRLLVITVVLLLVCAVSVFAWRVVNNKDTSAEPQNEPVAASAFLFDASKVSGWRQGPANESSMALFSNDQSCFVSTEYKSGSLDIAAESAKTQKSLSGDGYSVEKLEAATASVEVNSRATELAFEQFSVAGSGNAGQLYGGQAYGYAQLDDGYLYTQVNCNTSSQLQSALSAVSALSFKES